MVQVLFPQSYAQTGEWLRREHLSNQDALSRSCAQLHRALEAEPAIRNAVLGWQVCSHLKATSVSA